MVDYILCPRCGQSLRYVDKFLDYYCDYCRVFPFVPPGTSPWYPTYRPSFKRTRSSNTGNVIALIFTVFPLFLILIAYFFYVIPPPPPLKIPRTPMGALEFTESDDLIFTGSFVSLSKSVKLSDASLIITDASLGSSALMKPIVSRNLAVVEGGMNCSYVDNNQNLKIDGGDTIRVFNADSGDIIRFIYLPTGGVIADYTFA